MCTFMHAHSLFPYSHMSVSPSLSVFLSLCASTRTCACACVCVCVCGGGGGGGGVHACACAHVSVCMQVHQSIHLDPSLCAPHPPSLSIHACVSLLVFVHVPLHIQVHQSIHLDPSLNPPPFSLQKYLCRSLSRPYLCLSHSPLTCRFLGNNFVL